MPRYFFALLIALSIAPASLLYSQYSGTVIYNFTGGTDGTEPFSSLTETAPGVFIGTSISDLNPNQPGGTILFALTSAGAFKTLYTTDYATQGDGGGWPAISREQWTLLWS